MRKLNLTFLSALLAGLTVLGVVIYFLHDYQVNRNAADLLEWANRAKREGQLVKAVEALGRYVNLIENDGQAWQRYAEFHDEMTADSLRSREQTLLVYQQALHHNPGHRQLERKCAELAMEFGPRRISEAKTHLDALLAKLGVDPKKVPVDLGNVAKADLPEAAELLELYGDCRTRESKFEDADELYRKAIECDPSRVHAYFKLARIQRGELRKDPKAADGQIVDMVAKNPNSAAARLNRYQYEAEFGEGRANEADLREALRLAPEDPDVLLAAANNARRKQDLTQAREYIKKGAKLAPKNQYFALQLAEIELSDNHPDRAEAILRDLYRQSPSILVAFELAYQLIQKGKIDGEGQGKEFADLLKARGYGETYGRILDGLIKMRKERWEEAIVDLEVAQTNLKDNARLSTLLYGLLADCHRQTGTEEERLTDLENAVGEGASGEATRLQLAQALIRSDGPGELDRAIAILRGLAASRPQLELEIATILLRKTLLVSRPQRDWRLVDQQLERAKQILKSAKQSREVDEALTLLAANVLVAKNQLGPAQALLAAAQAHDRANPKYFIALSRLAMRQDGNGTRALQILDQAEKELGQSRELEVARLDYWSLQSGEKAKAEVAKLAEVRSQLPEAERSAYLEQLARAELRLGEPALARKYLRELAAAQPRNLSVLLTLFELTLEAQERAEAQQLIDKIFGVENPGSNPETKERTSKGTYWRFAEASRLIQEIQKIQEETRRGKNSGKTEQSGGKKATSLDQARERALEDQARERALEIEKLRPRWWGGPLLEGDIAAVRGETDEAIRGYQRAIELGNNRPQLLQRLIPLLNEKGMNAEIDKLLADLRDQENAPADLKLARALSAMRNKDYAQGIALAEELFKKSTRYPDHLLLGRFYADAGRLNDAGEAYRRAAQEIAPTSPEAWLTYVQFLVQGKRLEEAREATESARKALPADRSRIPLAGCKVLLGELKEAEALIQSELRDKPSDPSTLRFAVSFFASQGRTDDVVKCLSALESGKSGAEPSAADLAWVRRVRATILLQSGRPADREKASELVKENLAVAPSAPDLAVKASILATYQTKEARQEAISILEDLDKKDGIAIGDHFLLARLYLSGSEPDEQKYQDEMLKIVVNSKSTSPQHLGHYATYLINRKRFDEAEKWLGSLIQAAPEGLGTLEAKAALLHGKAENNGNSKQAELRDLLVSYGRKNPEFIGPVAMLLNRYGFPAEAESAYKQYVAQDTKKPERVLTLAEFLGSQPGRTREAFELFSRCRESCPPERVALAALSLYDLSSVTDSQRKEIEAWLTDACQKRPDLVVLPNKLAVLWIRAGRFDEAEELYRRSLSSDPQNAEALNNLSWLLALRDPSKTEEAVTLVNRAMELQGRTASLIDTLAVILIRADRAKEAIERLKEAGETDPKNPNVPLHMAWAQQNVGDKAEAQKEFQRAVALGWRADRSDPLERSFIEKLRRDIGP
jgi:tetratricopeptide (TPR) repeat protein